MTTQDLEKLRKIKAECQAGKVAGCRVDMTTAHVILTVYDALSDENKPKLLALSIPHAARVAFNLVKR